MKTTIKKPAAKARSKAPAVPLVSAAVRVLAVLDQLSRQRAIGLEDLSRQLKLAKPTVYRFLLTLQELGYARRVDGERWAMSTATEGFSAMISCLVMYLACWVPAHDKCLVRGLARRLCPCGQTRRW